MNASKYDTPNLINLINLQCIQNPSLEYLILQCVITMTRKCKKRKVILTIFDSNLRFNLFNDHSNLSFISDWTIEMFL